MERRSRNLLLLDSNDTFRFSIVAPTRTSYSFLFVLGNYVFQMLKHIFLGFLLNKIINNNLIYIGNVKILNERKYAETSS